MGYIYKITNIINGMSYIGQTVQKDPNTRWRGHINAVKYGNGCPVLSHAIQKYGPESFKFEVLIICFDSDVNFYEQSYIEQYKTLVPNGYNIQVGGNLGGMFKGHHHTEETKMVISKKLREIYDKPNVRTDHGQKVREGHAKSEKWKQAQNENRAFRKGVPMKIKRSAEHSSKISESLKKWHILNKDKHLNIHRSQVMSERIGRSVKQYTKDGVFIKEFPSIAEGARQTGLTRKNVQACVSGYTKSAGGFIWKGDPSDQGLKPSS